MYELNRDLKGLPSEETVRRHGLLEMRSRVAQTSFQPIRADYKEQLKKEREEITRVGFERMHNYIKYYLASPQRSTFYKEMANMKNFMITDTHTYPHIFIRDFLMAKLLVLQARS